MAHLLEPLQQVHFEAVSVAILVSLHSTDVELAAKEHADHLFVALVIEVTQGLIDCCLVHLGSGHRL